MSPFSGRRRHARHRQGDNAAADEAECGGGFWLHQRTTATQEKLRRPAEDRRQNNDDGFLHYSDEQSNGESSVSSPRVTMLSRPTSKQSSSHGSSSSFSDAPTAMVARPWQWCNGTSPQRWWLAEASLP
nr:hypothetical protein Iba_chr01bCG7320 [Ipomoea batatas]GME06468.1 hypothetical protein Iba_scaffold4341CG0010 [Ipomoea batatas]